MKKKVKEDELIDILKRGIVKVINDPESTVQERLKAMELGTKVCLVEAKIKDGDDGKGFFDK